MTRFHECAIEKSERTAERITVTRLHARRLGALGHDHILMIHCMRVGSATMAEGRILLDQQARLHANQILYDQDIEIENDEYTEAMDDDVAI